MESKPAEERIKPFRLVKYFTFSGITVIFLVIIMLSVLNTAWVRSMQRTNSEDYAQALIENLNHQVVLQFIIPVVSIYGRIKLSDKKQLERLDNVVRSTLHSFKVEALNIYSNNNTISYSFDRDMMGRKNYGGTGFQRALIGKSTSKLIQRGNFLQILLGFPKEVRLITFAPLRGVKPFGRFTQDVLGVVEFEQDLSEAYKTIIRIQILVVLTSTVLMGALFVVLIFVVKRREGIIQKRAMERLRLKERLSRAEKLSAIGELISGIAHELNNPLTGVMGYSELLQMREDLDDRAKESLLKINNLALRCQKIVQNLLRSAKFTSNDYRELRDLRRLGNSEILIRIRRSPVRVGPGVSNNIKDLGNFS